MLTQELKKILASQKRVPKHTIQREQTLPQTDRAIIITGVRRCGKSTLLRQTHPNALAINFEDPRLQEFTTNDFYKLEELTNKEIILDEVQNITGWEQYARSAIDRGKKLLITGSNASMLSKELGTALTGRHKPIELFPFSYSEYLTYTKQQPSKHTLQAYLQHGGFPEFLKEQDEEYLRTLLKDIVIRDITIRHNIRNEQHILRQALFMISNVGKEFSYNNMKKTLHIKSVRTVIDYADYLQESYLLALIPKATASIKKQLVGPKKCYAIDTGLAQANSLSLSEDTGRLLENAIFLQLRRTHNNIHYYADDNTECDFLIKKQHTYTQAIQVTTHLHEENKEREIRGLQEAMRKHNLQTGTIITLDQEDTLTQDNIHIIPAWKWLLNT